MEFKKVKAFMLRKLKKELPQNLTYHTATHIKDVYKASQTLARMEGVTGEDLELILTAALFHDSGFLWQQYEHESVSCEIAREYLPGFGYTDPQINRICGMIMATKIPQAPQNKLEEILCDADLDYLGREDFFDIGKRLYYEMCMYGIIDTEQEWNKLQTAFLEQHQYFTDAAKKLRSAKKNEYVAFLKTKIGEAI
jgi:uncharacterized protein